MMMLPLPIFSGHPIEKAPDTWRYEPIAKEKRKLGDLLRSIKTLKVTSLHGASVIGGLIRHEASAANGA
jgi:hypothetical protein